MLLQIIEIFAPVSTDLSQCLVYCHDHLHVLNLSGFIIAQNFVSISKKLKGGMFSGGKKWEQWLEI